MSSAGSSNGRDGRTGSDTSETNVRGRSPIRIGGRFPTLSILSALAFIALAGVFVWSQFGRKPQQQEDIQLWPMGTAQDIEDLADRQDVNVLFILVDTLRSDRMSAYGYERDTTPVLKHLSNGGIRFDRHLAQSSWTKSSMASMWTSFYPTRTGVVTYEDIIPEAAVLPAEVFTEAGFRTIGLYRNGWVAPIFGFGQGFEIYKKPNVSMAPRLTGPTIDPLAKDRGTDEETMRAAREFLRVEGKADQRWFLYLHMMDVHEYTYDEASAIFGSSYSDVYDSSILWTDTTIDILLTTMLNWGLLRNTVVVIASDHGEAFRERGHEGHARYVYKETTETPFIILLPFRLEGGGIVVNSRSRNVDIFPTLYELLGIESPPELDDADGISLLPDILDAARGQTSTEAYHREGFAHIRQGWGQRTKSHLSSSFSLTSGDLRYVNQIRNSETIEELFDARNDPTESLDLSLERTEDLERMRSRASELAEIDPVWGEPDKRDLSELELNQLRALGYDIE
jgi:arylsulfatase A-like enzyme